MKRPGKDGTSIDIILDAGEITTVKLANLLNEETPKV